MSTHTPLRALAEIQGEQPKLAYNVLYDGQCEICQACPAWLKTFAREAP